MARLSEPVPIVTGIHVVSDGNFALQFDNDDSLLSDATVDPTGDDDAEQWRLFQPPFMTPHFIVSEVRAYWYESGA
ncbi:MAG TPA: hypothetical protein VGI83_06485 [Gemmatimonadales bacterium]